MYGYYGSLVSATLVDMPIHYDRCVFCRRAHTTSRELEEDANDVI